MTSIEDINRYPDFPKKIMYAVFAVCALPLTLNLLGVDFASHAISLTVEGVNKNGIRADDLFHTLEGASHHALLEWSAVMTAFFTMLIAFAYYKITDDISAPIIGVALFCSSIMDAFHVFAALRLVDATAPNTDLIPFTWALSRSFNAIIMIVGAVLVLRMRAMKATLKPVLGVSAVFGFISYLLIIYAANSENLPQTQYPDAMITRPFDVVPLIFFLIAVPIFLKLYKKKHNLLIACVIIALAPEIILEAHMAFGSSHLFDNHFNIAHALKVLAYLVPFLGLLLDYIHSYKVQKETQMLLEDREKNLEQENDELEEFAYRTSHDLRSPLVSSITVLGVAKKMMEDGNIERASKSLELAEGSLKRLETLLQDILELTETKNKEEDDQDIEVSSMLDGILVKIGHLDGFSRLNVEKDFQFQGVITTKSLRLRMALENFVSNAVKYQDHSKDDSYVRIKTYEQDNSCVFEVEDNGLGIPKDQQDKLFTMFNRFHPKASFGSGLGLYLVKKSADILNAEIDFIDNGNGSTFKLSVPL